MENSLDFQYLSILQQILETGNVKKDRTGVGTKSLFALTIRHHMKDGFPLLTSKKVYMKGVIHELLWFLQGRTDLKYLVDNDVNIWVGDAYKKFCKQYEKKYVEGYDLMDEKQFIEYIKTDEEFSKQYGDLGPIYGKQWRDFGGYKSFEQIDHGVGRSTISGGFIYTKSPSMDMVKHSGIDQIINLINDLKNNPDSRRLMVTAWNPAEIEQAILPPCHYGFQCYTRDLTLDERFNWLVDRTDYLDRHNKPEEVTDEEINANTPQKELSLMWNQRSCDFPLGVPFNIASYGLLLTMLAQQTNMLPGELIGNFGDAHIYLNQLEGVKEQLKKETYHLPHLNLNKAADIFSYQYSDVEVFNYKNSGNIKYPLSN